MTLTNSFIPGLEIGRSLHEDVIKPALKSAFPQLPYAAALIGPGSEVLGFDTMVSIDHDWRPRVFIFVSDKTDMQLRANLSAVVGAALPDTFMGFPIALPQNDELRSRTVYSVETFWKEYLGFSSKSSPNVIDWLTFPEHILLGLTSGEVYIDEVGDLTEARNLFGYYPHDLWLYMMSAQWGHIAEEESFLGRAGDVGDETGSRIIAARLTRQIMRLCFMIEKKYCPYIKWFGKAFGRLDCSETILPLLNDVLDQKYWRDRQNKMAHLYTAVANMFAAKFSDCQFETKVSNFHTRPYLVLNSSRYAAALRNGISSNEVRQLPPDIGSVDQFIDCHEILYQPDRCIRLRSMYDYLL